MASKLFGTLHGGFIFVHHRRYLAGSRFRVSELQVRNSWLRGALTSGPLTGARLRQAVERLVQKLLVACRGLLVEVSGFQFFGLVF